MTLAQLRDFASTSAYQSYLEYKRLQDSLSKAEKQITPALLSLSERFSELSSLVDNRKLLVSSLALAKEKLLQVTAQYEQSALSLKNNQYLSAFYKESLEDITHKYLGELSKTLTDVYCSVYNRTDKQVQLVLEDYRGKKVVHLKYLKTYQGNIYPESIDNDGGSAQIILGIIIAIYFLICTNSPKVLFLDESLSALSTKVLQRFLVVLKKFSTEMGFVFVIIDHSVYRFRSFLDKLYLVENGSYRELTGAEREHYINEARGDLDD